MAQSFNSIEKNIARVLSAFPGIKRIIKKIYTRTIYLSKKKNYSHLAISKLTEISNEDNESFFGYYDKHPDNGDGLILVHNSAVSTSVLPKNISHISLNIYSLKLKKFLLEDGIILRAFNWQQGARAHWLTKDTFVFNDYDNESDIYITKMYSLDLMSVINELPLPVQDSFKDDFYLSLSYKKLALLRPDYGYFSHGKQPDLSSDRENGIWKVSYKNKKQIQVVSIEDILNFHYIKSTDDYEHKVNHIMISPDGNHFIFMHRYYSKSGRRYDRLILANSEGRLIKVLADNEMVSHCFWYDNSTVLGYLRNPDGIDGYFLIDLGSAKYKVFNQNVFENQGDGHPSVNHDYIITDTYPDKSRMQSLFLTKKDCNKSICLGEFFHGFNFLGETRCDLHPRLSSCSNFVFFDSVFSGKRKLYCMDITEAKKEL